MHTSSSAHPGRNDPCPCGSGAKYKKCCAAADTRRDRTLRLPGAAGPAAGASNATHPITTPDRSARHAALEAAARAGEWEVDAVPLNIGFDDAPEERPVGVLVVAAGFVLEGDVITMRSGEPDDVAKVLADHVATAARTTGHWPAAIAIRHPSVAPWLGRALGSRGVEVLVRHTLPDLDAAAAGLGAHMAGGDGSHSDPVAGRIGGGGAPALELDAMGVTARPIVSSPERWAAWGLPPDLVAWIFAAAARFHAARPWTHLTNTEILDLSFPGGGSWTACVMGNGGQEFGLSVYSEPDDFVALVEAEGQFFPTPEGSIVTLDFETKAALPPGMRHEITKRKWPVAGPNAYPRILCVNTPGGGLSRAWANTLALALDAVARFTDLHARILAGHPRPDPPLMWIHPESGVTVRYAGDIIEDPPLPWAPAWELAPGGAKGPGADPMDFVVGEDDSMRIRQRDRAVVAGFERWLQSPGPGRKRLAPTTARFHAMMAEAFVDCLNDYSDAGVGAIHELDLRVFLYDWFPRKVRMNRTDALRAPVSLGKFFDFLAGERGITCEWARRILDDRESFEIRWDECPGSFWWDASVVSWRMELRVDLDARALTPSSELAGLGTWGSTMGMQEVGLHGELARLWLVWREETIRGGITDPAEVRSILAGRQAAWEMAPHPGHDGRTPSDVVRDERTARP